MKQSLMNNQLPIQVQSDLTHFINMFGGINGLRQSVQQINLAGGQCAKALADIQSSIQGDSLAD